MSITATYSIRDNKIRLDPGPNRLPQDVFDRVKKAGFTWAPGQKIFIGQMWTPERFDLATELAGEVDDEDFSLEERAAARAERFREHSANRTNDAERAYDAVTALSSGIPLGQPILVGHHSRAHAERDAKRIKQGMDRAVSMWETAKYWEQRAKSSLRHASFKERDDVRHRRIKGLESDLRKHTKERDEAEAFLKMWTRGDVELTVQRARAISARDSISQCFTAAEYPRKEGARVYEGQMGLYSAMDDEIITPEQARDIAKPIHERRIEWRNRWIAHIENRIIFERAMLAEAGGLVAEAYDLQPGGRVLVDGDWLTIIRVTKKAGKAVSVTTNARYVRIKGVEEIKAYEAPTADAATAVKAKTTLPPLCNYDHPTFVKMTKAEWDKIYKDYKGSANLGAGGKGDRFDRIDVTPFAAYGLHRVRSCIQQGGLRCVFLTDSKVTPPPAAPKVPVAAPAVPLPEPEPDMATALDRPRYVAPEPTKFDALKDAMRTGAPVQVVSANQLFPTPQALAKSMVDMAGVGPGMHVLEPSAGTGAILTELVGMTMGVEVQAVEINPDLAKALRLRFQDYSVRCADFLDQTPEDLGTFDVILMNPPFAKGDDIRHIQHAAKFLKPGGRLVAICAGGPRQHEKLKPWVEDQDGSWLPLPANTFESSGTGVNTVLLSFTSAETVDA